MDVVWDSAGLIRRQKTRLLELFMLGVPVYRLRSDASISDR
ncbi:hypothetical protein [Burkholderia dolosa]|nr:hypothetical protein [Burkholderia dolosa]